MDGFRLYNLNCLREIQTVEYPKECGMLRSIVTAVMLLIISPSGAVAELGKGRPATCLLVVKGHEMIRGECTFTPIDKDGTFSISSYNGKYFAYVSIFRKGVANGSWNKTPYSARALTPLGTLYREEGCWVNNYASVCAY